MQFYIHKDRDDVVFVLNNAVFYTDREDPSEPILRRSNLDRFVWRESLEKHYLACGPYSIPGWAASYALELMMDYVNGIKHSVNTY